MVKNPGNPQNVKLDEFQIMPNHWHGIIVITHRLPPTVCRDALNASRNVRPADGTSGGDAFNAFPHSGSSIDNVYKNTFGPQRNNVSSIVRGIKSSATKLIWQTGLNDFKWQPRFHDMSYVKFWAHAVWGTKYHRPLLSDDFCPKLFQHIAENAIKKKIYVDCINGFVDHVHCLISMEPRQNIADIVQLLKGESSYWAGGSHHAEWKGWADDYCAISVSPSNVNRVRAYIRNQEKHHRKMTFQQEWDRFVRESGFVVAKDDSVHTPSIPAMNGGVSVRHTDSTQDRTGFSPSCKDLSQSERHAPLTPRFSGGKTSDMDTNNTNLIRQL